MPVATGEEQRESLQDVVTRNMRVAMALRGVNQTKLAEALGVDRSAISQKMTRRVAWSLEDIEKASGFFKVNPEALVAGHGFEPWTSGYPRGPKVQIHAPERLPADFGFTLAA